MKSTVSAKGQVVIPKPLRDSLGIRPGQELDFKEERGRLVVVKTFSWKTPEEDPFVKYCGIAKDGRRTDDIIRDLRGPPDLSDPFRLTRRRRR